MIKILVVLVIVLAIVALAQLTRLQEVAGKLRGIKQEDIPERHNKMNAGLMLVFMFALFVSLIWQIVEYGNAFLTHPASEHGESIDTLMNFNWMIILFVFFLVNSLLFIFAYKYSHSKDRKAFYYPHNNKLELLWTVVPTVVLAVIIIYGLTTWNKIMMTDADEDAIVIELYSKQFDWTARYAGNDNKLGLADYNMITATNPLGVITPEIIKEQAAELDKQIKTLEKRIEEEGPRTPDKVVAEWEARLGRLQRHRVRVLDIGTRDRNYSTANDDILVRGEFVIPKGRQVVFRIRSRDVIHSAYMPHFRAQMNAVPGMTTTFKMTPTVTTKEMREKLGDADFNYVLMCNKICGAAHYNMQMDIIVVEQDEYNAWLSEQATFGASLQTAELK
jgi:cytochrome c oxidase subunit II